MKIRILKSRKHKPTCVSVYDDGTIIAHYYVRGHHIKTDGTIVQVTAIMGSNKTYRNTNLDSILEKLK